MEFDELLAYIEQMGICPIRVVEITTSSFVIQSALQPEAIREELAELRREEDFVFPDFEFEES
jgi:hypothetical protein